ARVEHRTSAETARIAAEARRRIDAGEKLYDVLGDLHMSDNTYYKYKNKKGGRHTGSIDVSMLPPRPKRGNSHSKGVRGKNIDMNSVQAVAGRITYIDKIIAKYGDMAKERRELGDRLIMLIKAKPFRS